MRKQSSLLVISLIVFLTGFVSFVPYSGFSQTDVIFKKTGTQIQCKVKEITVDLIKYVRADVKKGPIIEIRKQEVYKIRYKNGAVEIIDPEYIKIKKADTTKSKNDTVNYSLIYIVYNSGQSTQVFPLLINGQYICRMSNHSRLVYKMAYEGVVNVCRQMKNKIGPCRQFEIIHGNNYGIEITPISEVALDPNDRFKMIVFDDPRSANDFIQTEYYSFKPFKGYDYNFVEKKE